MRTTFRSPVVPVCDRTVLFEPCGHADLASEREEWNPRATMKKEQDGCMGTLTPQEHPLANAAEND